MTATSVKTITLTLAKNVALSENNKIREDLRTQLRLNDLIEIVLTYLHRVHYDCYPIGHRIEPSKSIPLLNHRIFYDRMHSPSQVFIADAHLSGGSLLGILDLATLNARMFKQPVDFDFQRVVVDRNVFYHINETNQLSLSELDHENQLIHKANINLQDKVMFPSSLFFDSLNQELIVTSQSGDVMISRFPKSANDFYKDVSVTRTGKQGIVFAKSLPEARLVVVNRGSVSVWNTSKNKREYENTFYSLVEPKVSCTSTLLQINDHCKYFYSLPTCELRIKHSITFCSTNEDKPFGRKERLLTFYSEDFVERTQLVSDGDINITFFHNNSLIAGFEARPGHVGFVLHAFPFQFSNVDDNMAEPPRIPFERFTESKSNEPPLPRLTLSSTTRNEQIEDN